jgi:hypothetical protein
LAVVRIMYVYPPKPTIKADILDRQFRAKTRRRSLARRFSHIG